MLNLTGVENHKKLLSLLNSPLSLCVEYEISSKLIHLPFFVPKTWSNRWQVPTLTGVKNYKKLFSPLTSLDLCRVQNFKKIEAFTAFHPKLWPERWHVPTLAGVKNYKKLLSSINSTPSNCSLCKISWKMVNFIPCSPFPFLKISYFILRYCWEETRIRISGINLHKS